MRLVDHNPGSLQLVAARVEDAVRAAPGDGVVLRLARSLVECVQPQRALAALPASDAVLYRLSDGFIGGPLALVAGAEGGEEQSAVASDYFVR